MKQISIHQPVYLPWLGFIKKIMSSEIFVFLDDVQFEKNGWHNRNKIKTSSGDIWLTVPVNSKSTQKLNDITIDSKSNWTKIHSKSIYLNYRKSQYFDDYWSELNEIYNTHFIKLADLNLKLIDFLLEKFNIKTHTVLSSTLNISKSGSDRILEICKSLDSVNYLSGIQGKNYLKLADFEKNNILVEFQNFKHPKYNQLFGKFSPNLSAIDLLFNEGPNSIEILEKSSNF
jgi:hypothetical protein